MTLILTSFDTHFNTVCIVLMRFYLVYLLGKYVHKSPKLESLISKKGMFVATIIGLLTEL